MRVWIDQIRGGATLIRVDGQGAGGNEHLVECCILNALMLSIV